MDGRSSQSPWNYVLFRIRNSDNSADWIVNKTFQSSPNNGRLFWINSTISIRLLDGSYYANGYRYSTLDIADDGQSDTINDNKQYFPNTALARTQLATFPQYRTDIHNTISGKLFCFKFFIKQWKFWLFFNERNIRKHKFTTRI